MRRRLGREVLIDRKFKADASMSPGLPNEQGLRNTDDLVRPVAPHSVGTKFFLRAKWNRGITDGQTLECIGKVCSQ